MKFRTEYQALPLGSLSPDEPVLLMGSCFSSNIGERMRRCGWDATVNPAGTLYNPASIARVIADAIDDRQNIDLHVHPTTGSSFSFDFPTEFAACDADAARQLISKAYDRIRLCIAKSRALIVTFGTSIVYGLADNPDCIVGNCHKLSASRFVRYRLSVDRIVDIWTTLAEKLRAINPELKLIFTVSPIRHLNDGFSANARSKAVLLLACEELCARIPDAVYFPAFEILNDDLRDYRWYDADLAHPTQLAADYIWEKFTESFLDHAGCLTLAEGLKLSKRLAHRPLGDPASEANRQFEAETRRLLSDFIGRHPSMSFPTF